MHGFVDGSAFDYGDVDLASLEELIDSEVNSTPREKARFKTILCHENPLEVLREVVDHYHRATLEIREEIDFYSLELSRTIKRSDIEGGEREVEGSMAFYQHGDSPIWTAVTGYGPDFFDRGLEWLFKRAEPRISNLFADSDELREILSRIEEGLSAEILVSKTVVYSRTEEGAISFRTRPYKDVFTDPELETGYVDKLNFTVRRKDNEFFSGFISREGVTKLDAGDPQLFRTYLLRSFVEIVTDKVDVFTHTERSEDGEISEIELTFDTDVLTAPSDNQELIEAIDNLKKSTMTVYHDNPYAHLSVVDFVDGSNCDIYVTGPNSVSIVPGFKGSVNSLMRIADKMSKEFQEGDLHLRAEPEYDLTDFVASP